MGVKKIVTVFMVAALMVTGITGCRSTKVKKTEDGVSIAEGAVDLKGQSVTIAAFNVPSEDKQKEINDNVGKQLNGTIAWKRLDMRDYFNNLMQNIDAGTFDAQVILLSSQFPMAEIYKQGLLLPLDDYIDFSSEKFNKPVFNAGVWDGKHYGLITSFNTYYQSIMYYNKSIIARNGLPDPSEQQQTGQWTWDSFATLTSKIAVDSNGDGIPDVWGCAAPYASTLFTGLVNSNGVTLTTVNSDGSITSNLKDPRIMDAAKFFDQLTNVNKSTYVVPQGNGLDICKRLISGDKAAVYAYGEYPMTEVSENIGAVLYPKGPSAQKYACVADAGNIYAVPSSIKNANEIVKALEALYLLTDGDYDKYIEQLNQKYNQKDAQTIKSALDNITFVHYASYFPFSQAVNSAVNNITSKKVTYEQAITDAIPQAERAMTGDFMRYARQNGGQRNGSAAGN